MPDDRPDDEGTTAPWSADLEQAFEDAEQRAAVDAFLKETVQPYVTQLEEQSVAPRDAQRLWNDFSERPTETFAQVATELFGPEAAQSILNQIAGEEDGTDADESDVTDEDGDPVITRDDLDPETREAIEFIQAERQERQFDEALKELREEHSDIEIVDDLFYPFVTAAEGDLDVAIDGYREWFGNAKEKFGLNPPDEINLEGDDEADDAPSEGDEPPPTVSGTQNPSSPPIAKEYKSIDDAIDEFFAENKPAPPV